MGRIRGLLGIVGVVAAGAVMAAPAAQADPLSDPDVHCESQVFVTYCDGPVRPDGTFTRRWTTTGESYYAGPGAMGYIAPNTQYQDIDPSQPWPFTPIGAPQHHIGG